MSDSSKGRGVSDPRSRWSLPYDSMAIMLAWSRMATLKEIKEFVLSKRIWKVKLRKGANDFCFHRGS